MSLVIFYLVSCLSVIVWFWSMVLRGLLPAWLISHTLILECSFMGALGGLVYCFRGVYLNACVRKNWDSAWTVWYLIRPIESFLVGFVAYVFLKAGLLVLDVKHEVGSSIYGFLALSFTAGYNVDKFLLRLENIAHSAWGIKPSRASEDFQKNPE